MRHFLWIALSLLFSGCDRIPTECCFLGAAPGVPPPRAVTTTASTSSASTSSTETMGEARQAQPSPKEEKKKSEDQVAEDEDDDIYDPLEDWNRGVQCFNDMLTDILWDPLTLAYEALVPDILQKGIHNLLNNIATPTSLVNSILQFDAEKTSTHLVRFIINTIFGLGGLIDVAGECGVTIDHEDFGKTLKSVCVPPGFYLVLPIIGPSTLRDALGRIVDFAPKTLIPVYTTSVCVPQYCTEYVDTYLNYREARGQLVENFSDPYVVMRGIYYEKRGDLKTGALESVSDEDEDKQKSAPPGAPKSEEKKEEKPKGESSLWDGLDLTLTGEEETSPSTPAPSVVPSKQDLPQADGSAGSKEKPSSSSGDAALFPGIDDATFEGVDS